MHFPQLTIGKQDDPKGRSFTVHHVASIEARALCPPAGNGTLRPILLAYAGTPSAVRAFTANLRLGLTAALPDRRFELLRSLGYRYQLTSPLPGRALAIAYLPELFHLQPGVQGEDALRFVSAPPRWWLDAQEALLAPEYGAAARDHARAMAFVARLDARTPLPIANDPAFHHALYLQALAEPWTATAAACDTADAADTAEHRDTFPCTGLDALGLESPVLCDVSQQAFAGFLAAATARLLPREPFRASRPSPSPQPASPPPAAPPRPSTQLALDFLTATA